MSGNLRKSRTRAAALESGSWRFDVGGWKRNRSRSGESGSKSERGVGRGRGRRRRGRSAKAAQGSRVGTPTAGVAGAASGRPYDGKGNSGGENPRPERAGGKPRPLRRQRPRQRQRRGRSAKAARSSRVRTPASGVAGGRIRPSPMTAKGPNDGRGYKAGPPLHVNGGAEVQRPRGVRAWGRRLQASREGEFGPPLRRQRPRQRQRRGRKAKSPAGILRYDGKTATSRAGYGERR